MNTAVRFKQINILLGTVDVKLWDGSETVVKNVDFFF